MKAAGLDGLVQAWNLRLDQLKAAIKYALSNIEVMWRSWYAVFLESLDNPIMAPILDLLNVDLPAAIKKNNDALHDAEMEADAASITYKAVTKTIKDLKEESKNPVTVKVNSEVKEPNVKLGPEKFFSHGKKTTTGYAYEIGVTPKLDNSIDPTTIFDGGKNMGMNAGVLSNGLALTLSVIPSLGDRSVFVNDMNANVVRGNNPWKAAVNPTITAYKNLSEGMNKNVTRENNPWTASVSPKITEYKDLSVGMNKNVTRANNPWSAAVAPKITEYKDLSVGMNKNVTRTSNPWKAAVDPKLNNTKQYIDDIGGLTEEKTVKIKPELTDAKKFKEQLQSALKASASIKTTVSGTTKTIGKVSMSEYAQGGWPNIGDLFIANEAGPELVGTIGGSTAVANNDDIVQGIQGGVERANSEQNELIRQQNSILMQLLNKELTISPSVGLGQVMARSAALYGRA